MKNLKKALTIVLTIVALPAFIAAFSEGTDGSFTILNVIGIAYLILYLCYSYTNGTFRISDDD